MKKNLLLLLLLTSCKTVYVPVETIKIQKEIIRDTIVQVELVPYKDTVSILDTVSHLENKYAYSDAEFSTGRLNHSLSIKPIKIPTKVQYIEHTRVDSIPYKVEVIKEVNRLTRWQTFRLNAFTFLAIGVGIYLLILLRKILKF
jgi:hypothetical protein